VKPATLLGVLLLGWAMGFVVARHAPEPQTAPTICKLQLGGHCALWGAGNDCDDLDGGDISTVLACEAGWHEERALYGHDSRTGAR
jgi:hypothetical protein